MFRAIQSLLRKAMARRSLSADPPVRSAKRPRLDLNPLTPEDYKDGVMLAPMVRSGALPTRLFALKHGASLVWGPEIVDKAILHAERVVDPLTGVVSYNGKSRAIFTTHPIEKPYLIYQIGSADPETAVQAAKTVLQDVAGVDLNCGCPKSFSTHAGMGAALLTNPDLLCGILTALRAALPPEISLSAKIRLLPSQEDTLKLVERIVNTGVNALTVHCRTRNMRPRERALVNRLREIVDFVERMGKGVAVIENGDCVSREDAKRIREITGAHSAMIATAAESNPTCFSPNPLDDLEKTFTPHYIRLSKYLDNHWTSTKFCTLQFKGAHVEGSKAEMKSLRDVIVHAKGYDDLNELITTWNGEEEFAEIASAIQCRQGRKPFFASLPDSEIKDERENEKQIAGGASGGDGAEEQVQEILQDPTVPPEVLRTPPVHSGPPDPALLNAPLLANEMRMPIPAFVSGRDAPTPTPTPHP